MRWPENRMVLNESADWSRGEINVRPDMIQHFWTPDIIIHDLVRFTKPEILQEVAALEIIRDHSVYYKIRSEVTFVCRGMMFSSYPLDQHVCSFILTSYGYDEEQIKINGQFSYQRSSQRDLQFHTDIREIDLSRRVWQGEEKNYSMYGVEILLTRSLSPFVLSVYLPSGLLVIISWASFLLPPELARMFLLLCTSLLLLNMLNNSRSSAPISHSVTALEIWLLSCLLMMFLAILQFLFIIKTSAKHKNHPTNNDSLPTFTLSQPSEEPIPSHSTPNKKETLNNSTTSSTTNILANFEKFEEDVSSNSLIQKHRQESNLQLKFSHTPSISTYKHWNLDRDCRFIFPLMFSSLSCIYWIYFLYLAT